jgi:hypothetical protein
MMDARVTGPALLRHALANGTFSSSDSAARSLALAACPSPPRTLLVGPDGSLDPDRLFERFACARLWAFSKSSFDPRLRAECAAVRAAYERADALPACNQEFAENLCDADASLPWKTSPFTLAPSDGPGEPAFR